MTRITKKFAELKDKGEKALVPFFFAGDPDLDTTYDLVLRLEEAGADIIELGIPYTDPLADGPVNQAAAARALSNGITLPDILKMVEKLREKTQVPIAFLLYFNCVLQYGVEKFLADCEKAGVDGLVIPDLPMEEREQYKRCFCQIRCRHDTACNSCFCWADKGYCKRQQRLYILRYFYRHNGSPQRFLHRL